MRVGKAAGLALALLAADGCGETGPSPVPDAGSMPSAGAPLDSALAAVGRQEFRNRGCVACHRIGEGRLVGPDLAGVTGRRSFEWFRAMVLRPDSMILHDSTARALLREYAVPMTNQRATPAKVRLIWEYLRQEDAAGAAGG